MDIPRRDFLKLTAGTLSFAPAADRAWAQTAKTEVHWLGQAATKITTLTGKVIVIDPFLTNNPKTPPRTRTPTPPAKSTGSSATQATANIPATGRELPS